jgi:hypothetical protein
MRNVITVSEHSNLARKLNNYEPVMISGVALTDTQWIDIGDDDEQFIVEIDITDEQRAVLESHGLVFEQDYAHEKEYGDDLEEAMCLAYEDESLWAVLVKLAA